MTIAMQWVVAGLAIPYGAAAGVLLGFWTRPRTGPASRALDQHLNPSGVAAIPTITSGTPPPPPPPASGARVSVCTCPDIDVSTAADDPANPPTIKGLDPHCPTHGRKGVTMWVRWSEFAGWTDWRGARGVSTAGPWLHIDWPDGGRDTIPDHVVRGAVQIRHTDPREAR